MRALKPCVFFRLLLLGWNVLLGTCVSGRNVQNHKYYGPPAQNASLNSLNGLAQEDFRDS